MRTAGWTWPLLAVAACGGGDEPADTGYSVEELCAGAGPVSLEIGTGTGDEFFPLEDGDVVGLDVAPQGGFGVSVRVRTHGLVTGQPVGLLLEAERNGVNEGSFYIDSVLLYCQDDGSGLLWGVVVGLDTSIYATNDDLLALDGELIDLVVTATDVEGDVASGRVTVEIDVGG